MKKLTLNIKKNKASLPIGPPKYTNHPIDSQTSWAPLTSGGSSFKTHKLKEIDSDRVEFRSTIGARFFAMIFGGIGLAASIGGLIALFASGVNNLPIGIGLTLFGGIFAAVGIHLYRKFDKPIIFDLSDGLFWRGKHPNFLDAEEKSYAWCKTEEITGIQILQKRVKHDKSSYYSYEINLILEDAGRRQVVDHGHLTQISKDALQLGEFLQVPVWNWG